MKKRKIITCEGMADKCEIKTDYWGTLHQHNHPWRHVCLGYWSRYPNPHSTHVYTVDTLESRVVEGKLYTKRFILKNNPLPSWGEHFFSTRRVGLIEECVVDPSNNTMVAYVRNIGLTKFMGTTEKATFLPHPIDQTQTSVKKECWIDSSIFGFRSAIRKFGIERYKKNCILSTQGFEFVLDNLKKSDLQARSADFHSYCDNEELSQTSAQDIWTPKQPKVCSISSIPLRTYAFKSDNIV